ncbi:MAG: hypothetical protein RL272_8 [Candidatus Parcubacteria bacterium]|jgi:hypothetical protein
MDVKTAIVLQDGGGAPPVAGKAGDEGINSYVISLYQRHSELFQKDEAKRRRYFERHPTFFGCLKCMDGRVEFPAMTKTARGLVKPYRAIGGKFEMFWPAFQSSIAFWVKQAITNDAHSCIFVTSHFCSMRRDLGCKGWNDDAEAARLHMERLSRQMAEDFGEQLVAIPTSIDTTYDDMILHGPRGDISGGSLQGLDAEAIQAEVRRAFPDMHMRVIKDMTPFLIGNAERVSELKASPRSIREMEHDERVIAIGEGFDGLATENFALMNSDVNPNLDAAVVLSAKMIEKKGGGSKKEQATIFTNIFYGKSRGILSSLPRMEKNCAIRRSLGLQEFAQMHIRRHCPALWESGRLHFLTAVTREPTRELEVIEQGPVR